MGRGWTPSACVTGSLTAVSHPAGLSQEEPGGGMAGGERNCPLTAPASPARPPFLQGLLPGGREHSFPSGPHRSQERGSTVEGWPPRQEGTQGAVSLQGVTEKPGEGGPSASAGGSASRAQVPVPLSRGAVSVRRAPCCGPRGWVWGGGGGLEVRWAGSRGRVRWVCGTWGDRGLPLPAPHVWACFPWGERCRCPGFCSF